MEINNKVFCALPFTYVYVDSLNEYKLCSDARLSSQINTNDQSIMEYFNSDYLKEIRDDMLNGYLSDKIKGTCVRCIEREELGLWSRREKKIEEYIVKNYQNDFLNIPTVDTIKLKFGNLCNLKCLTCGPYSSSRWAIEGQRQEEINLYSELNDEIVKASNEKYGKLYQQTSPYENFSHSQKPLNYNFNEKFYDDLKLILKSIRKIIISGGEPFLNEHFYYFLQWLIENNFSDKLEMTVFSNLTKLPKNFKAFYDKFKYFTINVSIDGVGEKDEYIRRGTVFKEKDSNIKQLNEYFNLNFCVTLSILNVGYQSDISNYCLQFKKNPSFFNVLVEPFFLQVNNLPGEITTIYTKKGNYHKLFNSEHKNVNYFKIGIKFLKKYDLIHQTNLINEWPEFEQYYE